MSDTLTIFNGATGSGDGSVVKTPTRPYHSWALFIDGDLDTAKFKLMIESPSTTYCRVSGSEKADTDVDEDAEMFYVDLPPNTNIKGNLDAVPGGAINVYLKGIGVQSAR